MSQALKAPKPALPRNIVRKDWCSRARDKHPLTSNLTGSGRAGKYGELAGREGGRYTGEVLAGRPHGLGQYFTPTAAGSTVYTLRYDGAWIQVRSSDHPLLVASTCAREHTADKVHF